VPQVVERHDRHAGLFGESLEGVGRHVGAPRLNTKSADAVATRLRAAASDMIEDDDRELLKAAAGRLETVSTRIKAATPAWSRVKAAPAPRPESDIAAMIGVENSERMASAGPFDRDSFEDLERARIEEQNAQLAARDRQGEESRRR
jgi:hypothetical protein